MIAYSPKSGTLLRISIHLAGSKASFKWTNESSGTSASEMLAYDKLKLKWMMSLKRPFHT
jgi:hypothetical protein